MVHKGRASLAQHVASEALLVRRENKTSPIFPIPMPSLKFWGIWFAVTRLHYFIAHATKGNLLTIFSKPGKHAL